MKITYNNRLLKRIPEKYGTIRDITDHLMDFDYIRLSQTERKILDKVLFIQKAETFLMYLSLLEPIVYEQVKDAKPISAGKIKDANGETCSILKMSNGISIRCDEVLCSLSPIKFKPAKENVSQLTIFE